MSDFEQFFCNMIPGMLFGALVGGLASAARTSIQGTDNFTQKLKFQPEAFDIDLNCGELFFKLQQFRMLSPDDFDEAGCQADNLFCLEKQLTRNEIKWDVLHPVTAQGYAREMSKRLHSFLDVTKGKLYSDRVYQHDLFEQQRASDHDLEMNAEEAATNAQLLKDIESGKQTVRTVNQLITDIKVCIKRHVTKVTGGFHTPLHGLYLNKDAPGRSQNTQSASAPNTHT